MTTPAQPDTAPRHARTRAAAASRNAQAAKAAKSASAAKAGAGPQGAALYGAQRAGTAARNVGRTVGQARIPGDRGYQPVILAEFLAAVVIITLTPIATGGSPAAKAKNSPSPYDTGDLRQLVAVGGVYFVLALLSSGNSGRLSAWFGGLVLLALGLSKVAHGQLSAVFHTVSGDTAVKEAGQDPFGNPTPA